MALYILNTSAQPIGVYDFLDTDLANVLGGEVGTLDEASRTNSLTEKAASDARDGYVADLVDTGDNTATRAILRIADTTTESRKLFYLLDDGSSKYGNVYGDLIGAPVGLATTIASGGTALGPHSAAASGKVTAWGTPGLFAVSTDAVADSLDPGSATADAVLNDTPLPGELLYREQTTGLLTAATTSGDKIGMFVELAGNGSLVNTPASLVGAAEVFDRIKFQYLGAGHNA